MKTLIIATAVLTLGCLSSTSAPLAQESGGVRINAHANTISNTASGGSTAVTTVGGTTGGNTRIDAQVRGSVTTTASGGHRATTSIGVADGNADIDVSVQGDVVTSGRGRDASTYIGATTSGVGRAADTSVSVSGDVHVEGGDLVIGGNMACKGYRDNKCCIEFHANKCVISKVPENPEFGCPPGYFFTVGWCRLYSDLTEHSYSGR
ncbi:hypothetical protein [Rhodospirillum rubrum]|uniref:Uncharacterized protein n=1 Tax=Rhodospirillum rubrum (strain ATCC 11170 / ATH 1.1.1 / DSM 467 / LMG 4362 / NCIMB 8255 / S1) TaxID=269796 RepID=Q2RW23_RHORT|nr:hypothetical protein [Rhodospirillum rubrum]ABC21672.1 hypothetical protein Rru_A0871 [Rhodospirillum rubrum ATCC 11170]AEO47370.1 hypothetical protein F11_04500 [Rhodospirillum rubrum F11]MBK5953224.1 hypothetical protein [Rhodospirillum rubrum]QXG81337.1 hypothetical protein KUL73_04550 [Rhodospirillum rubrum]